MGPPPVVISGLPTGKILRDGRKSTLFPTQLRIRFLSKKTCCVQNHGFPLAVQPCSTYLLGTIVPAGNWQYCMYWYYWTESLITCTCILSVGEMFGLVCPNNQQASAYQIGKLVCGYNSTVRARCG